MHPDHGVRVQLERAGGASGEIRYEASLFGPAPALWRGPVVVHLDDGSVALGPFSPGDPPPWVEQIVRAFLRGEWRARRNDPENPWPDRITRWRAAS